MSNQLCINPSARLRYRLLGSKDANLLFELDQDPDVMRFISNGQITPIEKIHSTFIPRLAAYTDAMKGWGMWGVFCEPDDIFSGWILVRPMYFFSNAPEYKNLELGWRFKKNCWGKGIATEAARHIMDYLHTQTGINTFSAIAVTENTASINIMHKLGMQYVSSDLHKDPLGDMHVDKYTINIK